MEMQVKVQTLEKEKKKFKHVALDLSSFLETVDNSVYIYIHTYIHIFTHQKEAVSKILLLWFHHSEEVV